MYDGYYNDEFGGPGLDINPARDVLVAPGYDRNNYISTAQLTPTAYTSQNLIQAKIGGLIKLIEACDDSQPPQGDLNGDAGVVLGLVIQNVTTEINGYLSTIYPMPLAQTGTVAVIQITGISTDGLGTITAIKVLEAGNYATAPAQVNTPAYLRYIDPLLNAQCWGQNWFQFQQGTGAQFTVAYGQVSYSDESGQTLQAYEVTGTPTITAGGTKYCLNQILVLTGGSSFVPAKVREAALVLICHDLNQRRLAQDEKNLFANQAKMWRGEEGILMKIGHGEQELDGTYKRSFSPGSMWGNRSVFFGANSL